MTDTNRLVEHFFRHEYANLVAVLTRAFGVSRIDLVEDMVGTAILQAMHSWKQKGAPDNPVAWIHSVARNRILDTIRREKTAQQAIAFSGWLQHANANAESVIGTIFDEPHISDSLLRMMFVCCHPTLHRTSQIALTLKVLCGFSVSEIAKGLLISAAAVKKRIQRAKSQLARQKVSMEMPHVEQLPERLSVVHDVLYLLFNEGYSASRGTSPIRDDVCEEAARLCHMLCQHEVLSTPNSRALLSLMLFHAARLDSRVDALGHAILLEDQDRSVWDKNLIEVAHRWLIDSVREEPSRFHFEAVLAQVHCSADSFAETDWLTIIKLYDRLIENFPSPLYCLNRAIAIAQSGDPKLARQQLLELRDSEQLKDYFLLECAIGHVTGLSGDVDAATDSYLKALSFDIAEHQRDLVMRRLEKLPKQHR